MVTEVGKGRERSLRFCMRFLAALWLLSSASAGWAGPPFLTDDPEPVELRHGEFYIASQHSQSSDGWSGTGPHLELNYGPVANVQFHLIAPLAYDAPTDERIQYGYGDTELGLKYRFIQETDQFPQIGVFPLVEIPTGNTANGLGGGFVQAFLPVWLQKSFGPWTVYGGGGWALNPGADNRDWRFLGMVLQCQVRDNVLVGGEIYHRTMMEVDGRADTAFNLGAVVDFSENHHLLFSAGRSIDGPIELQIYIAYQFTGGPP